MLSVRLEAGRVLFFLELAWETREEEGFSWFPATGSAEREVVRQSNAQLGAVCPGEGHPTSPVEDDRAGAWLAGSEGNLE